MVEPLEEEGLIDLNDFVRHRGQGDRYPMAHEFLPGNRSLKLGSRKNFQKINLLALIHAQRSDQGMSGHLDAGIDRAGFVKIVHTQQQLIGRVAQVGVGTGLVLIRTLPVDVGVLQIVELSGVNGFVLDHEMIKIVVVLTNFLLGVIQFPSVKFSPVHPLLKFDYAPVIKYRGPAVVTLEALRFRRIHAYLLPKIDHHRPGVQRGAQRHGG